MFFPTASSIYTLCNIILHKMWTIWTRKYRQRNNYTTTNLYTDNPDNNNKRLPVDGTYHANESKMAV